MDLPLGNPPQLRQTVIGVVRMRRFAVAKPYMDSSRFASISSLLDWGTTAHVYPAC